MARVRSISHAGILAAAVLAGTLVNPSAWGATTDNWTGGAGDGKWSTGGNWSLDSAPTTAQIAGFGDSAPNAAQVIEMDVDADVSQVSFANTLDRTYTINSAAGHVLQTRTTGGDFVGTSTAGATFNVDVQPYNGVMSLQADNVTFNGDFVLNAADTTAGVTRSLALGDGKLFLNGQHLMGLYTNLGSGTYVVGNVNAMGGSTVYTQSYMPTILLASNLETVGTFGVKPSGNIGLYDATSASHTFTADKALTYAGALTIVANPLGGTGHLTMKLLGNGANSQTWTTIAGSVIELGGTSTTSQSSASISGAGSVLISGSGTKWVNAVHSYTGGTEISAGTLQMRTGGVMPTAGLVQVDSGAIFDLNGITTAIGGLGGKGNVNLAGAALTVNEGVSPGASPGKLTIAGTGSVVLGSDGTSVFELAGLNGVNDQVVFSGAAGLTLGGELKVLDAGGLEAGEYTLFVMGGGSAGGAFSAITMPTGFSGTVGSSGENVVLEVSSLAPEPGMLGMLAAGGMMLAMRRRRFSGRGKII
jgi:autotransporter-associated beta strand protein